MVASIKQKVFVGLSGGVDSAVCAALLQKRGYEVVGLFAFIALPGYPCTAGEDRREALRVATHLQIPFEEIDLSVAYQQKVFEQTLDAYRKGETPNPDALCNREIKFGLLYDYAMEKGADLFATGHYARTSVSEGSTLVSKVEPSDTKLFSGKDKSKDQSYFLWAVPQEKLARTLFPIGELHKTDVRKLAKKFKLPNAERKDSQGLCFIGAISFDEALTKELRPTPGLVLNMLGQAVGTHRGAALYTIGQRHGFEVPAESKGVSPHYVVAKDIEQNTITVSPQSASAADLTHQTGGRCVASLREENWIGEIASGSCQVRFRYRQKLLPAELEISPGNARVILKRAPPIPVGQSLVLYKGQRCLGGGVIARVR